ncbi:hypothetical protein SUSAZ_07525 [Sulfolobus acidocaldarius SUSAZ]|nr:hypothetical protein SUSAZ_07525 [Sulfolobus acidocaldarius SUSAZ]
MSRIGVKGRDMESLLYMGKIKSVNVEYCDEAKKQAKVVATLVTGDEVETECIPVRAAGKISIVIKHYLRMGVDKMIIREGETKNIRNVDTEEGEDETENKQDS